MDKENLNTTTDMCWHYGRASLGFQSSWHEMELWIAHGSYGLQING